LVLIEINLQATLNEIAQSIIKFDGKAPLLNMKAFHLILKREKSRMLNYGIEEGG
jgi:hypothetical protein